VFHVEREPESSSGSGRRFMLKRNSSTEWCKRKNRSGHPSPCSTWNVSAEAALSVYLASPHQEESFATQRGIGIGSFPAIHSTSLIASTSLPRPRDGLRCANTFGMSPPQKFVELPQRARANKIQGATSSPSSSYWLTSTGVSIKYSSAHDLS